MHWLCNHIGFSTVSAAGFVVVVSEKLRSKCINTYGNVFVVEADLYTKPVQSTKSCTVDVESNGTVGQRWFSALSGQCWFLALSGPRDK